MKDNSKTLIARVEAIESSLRERYGELIGLSDLAELFHFPTVEAVRKARLRGRLPISVAQLPNRRGWFASPRSVAEVLANFELTTKSEKEILS